MRRGCRASFKVRLDKGGALDPIAFYRKNQVSREIKKLGGKRRGRKWLELNLTEYISRFTSLQKRDRQSLGMPGGPGEKAVAGADEDSVTMAIEAGFDVWRH